MSTGSNQAYSGSLPLPSGSRKEGLGYKGLEKRDYGTSERVVALTLVAAGVSWGYKHMVGAGRRQKDRAGGDSG